MEAESLAGILSVQDSGNLPSPSAVHPISKADGRDAEKAPATAPALYFADIKSLPDPYGGPQELAAAQKLDGLRERLCYAPFREAPAAAYVFMYLLERNIRSGRKRLDKTFHGIDQSDSEGCDAIRHDLQKKVRQLKKLESCIYTDSSGKKYSLEAPKYIQRGIEIAHSLALSRKTLMECVAYVQEQDLPVRARENLQRYRKDYQAQFTDFCEHNLRLVVSIVQKTISTRAIHQLRLEDLIQEGNLGLLTAVERFDFRRGYRFSTYAVGWIRQAIAHGITDKGSTIRIPIHLQENFNSIKKEEKILAHRLRRMPEVGETAQLMGVSEKKVAASRIAGEEPRSLDSPLNAEDEVNLYEFLPDMTLLPPEEKKSNDELRRQLTSLFSRLTPREEKVLRLRFGIDTDTEYTLKEIGERIGLTRERARQIQNKALQKLRKLALTRGLESHL